MQAAWEIDDGWEMQIPAKHRTPIPEVLVMSSRGMDSGSARSEAALNALATAKMLPSFDCWYMPHPTEE